MVVFEAMTVLACLMHWYVSMLYVVPVIAVGGWGWWSARRMSQSRKTSANESASKLEAGTSKLGAVGQ
jgi:protein-S-isoprenylcysteine O-methyltransferase Ste14